MTNSNKKQSPFNIALCVRLPNFKNWKKTDIDFAMQEFVEHFCINVFNNGGRIILEAPSAFIPIVVYQARRYPQLGKEKLVTVYIPTTKPNEIDSVFLKNNHKIVDIRIIEETQTLPKYLLQGHVIQQVDYLVTMGGATHDKNNVWQEIKLAVKRQIPTFIIGGTGGETDFFMLKENKNLNNGLTYEQNYNLLSCKDVFFDTAIVCQQILTLDGLDQARNRSNLNFVYPYYSPGFYNSIVRKLRPEIKKNFIIWYQGFYELRNKFAPDRNLESQDFIEELKSRLDYYDASTSTTEQKPLYDILSNLLPSLLKPIPGST